MPGVESIQRRLERMLPEFNDWIRRGLFSEAEVSDIVDQRRKTEVLLGQRNGKLRKLDFVRAIQYEMKLNMVLYHRIKELRKLNNSRKKQLASGASNFAIISRIHDLYERALHNYSSDVSLWEEYFAFCVESNSEKKITTAFTKAIQHNPLHPPFWIKTAMWEYDRNDNVQGARVFLERGLRLNKESRDLWIALFKLEILELIKLDIEGKFTEEMGLIPQKVYDHSILALDNSSVKSDFERIELRLSFIDNISDSYPLSSTLKAYISATILHDFNHEPYGVYKVASQLPIEAGGKLLRESYSDDDSRISEWLEFHCKMYHDLLCATNSSDERYALLEELEGLLKRVVTFSEKLYFLKANLLIQQDKVRDAIGVLDDAVEKYPCSEILWLKRLQVSMATDEGDVLNELINSNLIRSELNPEGASRILFAVIDGILCSSTDTSKIMTLFTRLIQSTAHSSFSSNYVKLSFLEWLRLQGITNINMSHTDLLSMLMGNASCPEIVLLLSSIFSEKETKITILESAIQTFDQDKSVWIEYLRIFEGDNSKIDHALWKSKQIVRSPEAVLEIESFARSIIQ